MPIDSFVNLCHDAKHTQRRGVIDMTTTILLTLFIAGLVPTLLWLAKAEEMPL